jgi:hypothetical protein
LSSNSEPRVLQKERSWAGAVEIKKNIRAEWCVDMDSLQTSTVVGAIAFASGVVGVTLHRLLPKDLVFGALRDMTGAVSGLLILLTTLVLGLLISTAYGVFSNQSSAVRNLAIEVLQLDLALSDYGVDAAPARAQLRESVPKGIEQIWHTRGNSDVVARSDRAAIVNLRERQDFLSSLRPTTDAQRQALAAANHAATLLSQTRLQMALALTDPVSRPLIFVVVVWSGFIFLGFGFLHGSHPSTLVAIATGASVMATAVYLVLALSEPYTGLLQVSPAPLEQVLTEMRN